MKILLPFDGSAQALEAVGTVIGMAKDGLALEVVLVNVQEPATLYELMLSHDPGLIEQAARSAGEHILQPALQLLQDAGLAVQTEVASGDPAHTLIDLLENYGCHVVVMGASGANGLRSALLGSVSNEVLHAASVPVMIVKAPEDAGDAVDQA